MKNKIKAGFYTGKEREGEKMEMRAKEDIEIGQDITPPLQPIAASLYDAYLLSHCSSCFSPLPNPPFLPTFPNNSHPIPNPTVFYCSSQCSTSDSLLHFSSAEHHLLLQSQSADDSSDLRLSLRFLLLNPLSRENYFRICGLLTNREELMSRENLEEDGDDDDDIFSRVRDGAKAMATARRMRDGEGFDVGGGEDLVMEEAVLCSVITNAVEVQVNGGSAVGIALYDTSFSWINHSCSPNACYRFLVSPAMEMMSYSGESRLRIVPGGEGEAVSHCENGLRKGGEGHGPKVIVRSIKAIRKGEEVTIAYTDLLQPKAIRQSELWLNYQFICCCSRCLALPPTYVDHALQEILVYKHGCNTSSTEQIFYRNEAITKMIKHVDDVITQYLSIGNSESCCEKLEYILTQGCLYDHSHMKEVKCRSSFRVHPLHHLSLNAYTTLASAYKVRASHLLAVHPETSVHQLEAFNMSRNAAAYALLLAGATHHLFLNESSLIASTANFWTSAGESLLGFVRSSVSNLILKRGSPPSDLSSHPSNKCNKCSLMDRFEANFFCGQSQTAVFEDVSKEFLDCITNITPKVWAILNHGCPYLRVFRDPIDLSWLDSVKASDMWDPQRFSGNNIAGSSFEAERSMSSCDLHEYTIQDRDNLFQFASHSLLYGGILSNICYGQHSNLTSYVRNLLFGEKEFHHPL